jgi:GH24 family phage-related lysozyme (muramidase)
MRLPSKNTLKLIYDFEVGGGESYYNKFLKRFTWPGLQSGPTIGIGVDCAYYTKQELKNLFSFLPPDQIDLVCGSTGKTGEAGKEYTKVLREAGIEVSWNQAQKIFLNTTWAKFSKLTDNVFQGSNDLCDDAYGALVSLVFNRGSSLSGNSRSEMRDINNLVPQKNYHAIARKIRSMKRLWFGKGMDGLIDRREREAQMVESCVTSRRSEGNY